jgi:hypothetical protein
MRNGWGWIGADGFPGVYAMAGRRPECDRPDLESHRADHRTDNHAEGRDGLGVKVMRAVYSSCSFYEALE